MAGPQPKLEEPNASTATYTLWDLTKRTQAKSVNRIPADSVNKIEIYYLNKLPTPGLNQHCAKHWYSFALPTKSNENTHFTHRILFEKRCLSDSGCSRTVIAKDVLQKQGIKYDKNELGERLLTAGGHDLNVSGIITLEGGFKNEHGITKTTYMHCLVSDSLTDEIIVSSVNSEAVGSLTIAKDFDRDSEFNNATSRCAAVLNPLSEEELKNIKAKWFKEHPNCLSDVINDKPMKGEPMVINLRKDVKVNPKKWFTPIKIPLHFKQPANELLDQLIEKGIIRQLPKSTPTKFCARGFFVAKPGGIKNGVRLVVDHKEVNRWVERPTHPFIAGTQLLKEIPHDAVVFAKLDALWGYYQIPLAEESQHITTFVCERGTFEYLRAPMGLNSSGDEFCRRSDDALKGLKGVLKLVDDIMIYATSYEELFKRVEAVLNRCSEHNITLSRKKIEIGSRITFAGFDVSSEGITPTWDRIEAIRNFPTPKNPTGVRSFNGLTQGLSSYAHDLAIKDAPLRDLLKGKTAFTWGPDQEESFKTVKEILTSPPVLKNFNPHLETQVVTDGSRLGIGFILRQRDKAGEWRLIQCGSRALNGPESRYAVCEIEALGVLYAIQKCRHFLLGMSTFEVATDHKSLKGVFAKDLAAVENVRLRRCMERLQEYTFTVTYIEGKKNSIADTLSRFPVKPAPEITGELEELTCICNNIQSPINTCYAIGQRTKSVDPRLQELIDMAKKDEKYQQLVTNLKEHTHFKNIRSEDASSLNEFQNAWDKLSIHPSSLVVYNNERIVVPKSARDFIICQIHKSHCGVSKSLWRARRDYWWLNYDKDIESHVKRCSECVKFLPSQQMEPLINQNKATEPMEIIGLDLAESHNRHYLIMVDMFSGFPFVQRLNNISTSTVKQAMSHIFNLFGNPYLIIQDNGTQLTSRPYQTFLKNRGIECSPGSPYYPQSNGLAEACVKNIKGLLQKCGDNWAEFDDCLLDWRDTPNECGYSPGEIFFARRMRSSLPILPGKTSLNACAAEIGAKVRKELRSKQYEKRRTKPLAEIQIGQDVYVQDHSGRKRWNRKATVTGKDGGRGYTLITEDGTETARNRSHIKPIPDKNPENSPVSNVPGDTPAADHECLDEEAPDSRPVVSADSTAPANAPPRRSSRIKKEKVCQSCDDCRLIETYLFSEN